MGLAPDGDRLVELGAQVAEVAQPQPVAGDGEQRAAPVRVGQRRLHVGDRVGMLRVGEDARRAAG